MRNQVSPFGNSNYIASFHDAVSCGLDVCKAIGTSIGILALLFLPVCVCIASNAVSMLWVTAVRRCAESEISHGLQVITQLALPPFFFLWLVFKHIFGLQSDLVFTQRRDWCKRVTFHPLPWVTVHHRS